MQIPLPFSPFPCGFAANSRRSCRVRCAVLLAAAIGGVVVGPPKAVPAAEPALPPPASAADTASAAAGRRLLFTSQGRTGFVQSNGAGLRYLDLQRPLQVRWQPGPVMPDGARAVFLSMEERRDGPGRPFDEFYTQTPCHLWLYDFDHGTLEEICQRDRMAPFMTPSLLLGDERILVQVVRDQVGQIYSMRLDGSDAREFTRAGEGMPYGLSLSPDGRRVAFHLAGPEGYQIWTSDLEGKDRVRVAADPAHLYFGTQWSPDGRWILYVDCHHEHDPGHDWADVCIGRADGGEHRVLTGGQSMWFAATYGDRKTRGGGSNVPTWTPDGTILFPRRLPDAKVAWEFAPNRPDVDHFNRDFKPELARGGSEIVELDPRDGSMKALTHSDPPVWDFRATISADGREIAFCRAATGEAPALWVMQRDGSRPRRITQGINDRGADNPLWLPVR
jgi:Tol biopolymer transport system component